jgi:hypothetical protein
VGKLNTSYFKGEPNPTPIILVRNISFLMGGHSLKCSFLSQAFFYQYPQEVDSCFSIGLLYTTTQHRSTEVDAKLKEKP